jgi:hypothetical protein
MLRLTKVQLHLIVFLISGFCGTAALIACDGGGFNPLPPTGKCITYEVDLTCKDTTCQAGETAECTGGMTAAVPDANGHCVSKCKCTCQNNGSWAPTILADQSN